MFFTRAGRASSCAAAALVGTLLPHRSYRPPLFAEETARPDERLRKAERRRSGISSGASNKEDNGVPRHGPLRIFTGNAHPELAKEIADHMKVPLGKVTVGRFNCGEINVVINESVRDCDVFVVQPTCNGGLGPNEHLMELLIMIDALRRGAAARVTAVIPSYGYARQNAKEQSRAPITAKLVTDLLEVAGASRVLTVELHASQIQGFASYPIDNMYTGELIATELRYILRERGLSTEDVVVVSPDVGGAKRASALAKKLCVPLAIFSRQRRRATTRDEIDLVGDVTGKFCIIIDGISDTGDTMCVAANKLKARGASAVIGAVVHGVFSDPACQRMEESALELVLVTDTIPLHDKMAACPKLRVLSIAPLLAEAIVRTHTGDSLSELFELRGTQATQASSRSSLRHEAPAAE